MLSLFLVSFHAVVYIISTIVMESGKSSKSKVVPKIQKNEVDVPKIPIPKVAKEGATSQNSSSGGAAHQNGLVTPSCCFYFIVLLLLLCMCLFDVRVRPWNSQQHNTTSLS